MKFSDQVVAALTELHPGVRRAIRRALDDVNLGENRDVRALTDRVARTDREAPHGLPRSLG